MRPEDARDSYERALGIDAGLEYIYGAWLHSRMKICDWSGLDADAARLFEKIENGEPATLPFPLLALVDSPSLQRKAAEIWIDDKRPGSLALPPIAKRARPAKIRIGYFSADFHNHATSHLIAELFERHDRNRFEIAAFSFGPDNSDEMRKRIRAASDLFVDVRRATDKEIALKSRELAIDIAIDLKGLTQANRMGIFARRAAPIQVSYLGYPGTCGAKYIDYLIADATLIPPGSRQHYHEKIAYLPHTYQVNDRRRLIADRSFSREELGLPPAGFVFCSFNNNYKITRAGFESWMRILGQVDGSVLWLLEDNPTASRNLRMAARARGVSDERLVFAKRLPVAEHLARHRAADLFIDTLPCNAHTTASDALWAGLPVLTCIGEAFAARVAASLLRAVGLPELITDTRDEYETLAVELATNPRSLGQIKKVLAQNRLGTPLFDSQLFTAHIEAAYAQMHEKYQSDLPPDHIFVSP